MSNGVTQHQAAKRVFLGWKQPTLQAARDYLKRQYLRGNQWNMDGVLLVLPSSYAGRRLGEILAEHADRYGWLFRPPEIVTVGALPEKLYQAQYPFANDLVQILCWAKVLREAPLEKLTPLLVEVPPRDAHKVWIDLGRMLSNLHRELATDLMLFTDVADRLRHSPEQARWRVLAFLQREYLNLLHQFHLWDIQTARRVAIDRGESHSQRDVIVLGAVDLNRAQRRFLDAVADRVTVLIGAPETWKAGFDGYGALEPEFWQNLEVPLDDESIHVCNSLEDAAEEVTRQLANLPAGMSTQQITIGVPDAEVIPVLCEQLARSEVTARYGPGSPVNQSSPMRLLDWISDYIGDGSFASFATLIRHPMIAAMLRAQHAIPDDYLNQIDQYYNATLLTTVRALEWPEAEFRDQVQAIANHIDDWLRPLRSPPQPLTDWAAPLLQVVQQLFGDAQVQLDDPQDAKLYAACSHLRDAITQLDDIPQALQVDASFVEAIGWLKSQTEKERIPPETDPSAIEMLGWLELALDDTDALLLTGLHDGTVPESVNADAFLPNELRKELGLIDNARRYARDCYVLHTILHTRKHLSVVIHQLNQKGDPLTPSRLLLAIPADHLANRVQRVLQPPLERSGPRVQGRWRPLPGKTAIPIPKPREVKIPTSLPVTDFKTYSQCPYRYYLSRIEKLRGIDDLSEELQANAFGNLLHNCLEDLKGSPVEQSDSAEDLQAWLFQHLDEQVLRQYGRYLSSTVAIQIEQAKQRLAAFAALQAERVQQKWTIFATEYEFKAHQAYAIEFEGGKMWVHGRIDRIDFQPSTRTWAIWDYKSNDAGTLPEKAHYVGKKWKDFQLPLYRKLIQTHPKFEHGDKIQVGYILLPKSAANCKFASAEFTDEALAEADLDLKRIAQSISQGIFWPPQEEPQWDDFASICQTQLARPWRPSDEAQESTQAATQSALHSDASENASTSLKVSSTAPLPDEASLANQLNLTQAAIPGWMANRLAIPGPPRNLVLPNAPGNRDFPAEWLDPLVIQASAGTGKTYRLSIRMMQLLFTEQPLDHVLATTFTRKAAGEILHRVLGRLAEAILEPKKLAELRQNLAPLKIEVEHCQYQLARLCAHLHRFRVSTLDAFYAQLAKSFSLELQLPPGWSLADPFEENRLRDLAINKMLGAHDRTKLRTLVSMLFKGESDRNVQNEIRKVVDQGYRIYRNSTPEAWLTLPEKFPPTQEALVGLANRIEQVKVPDDRMKGATNKLVAFLLEQDWTSILEHTLIKNRSADIPTYYRVKLPTELIPLLFDAADAAADALLLQRRYQTQASYDLLHAYHLHLETTKREERTVTFDDIAWKLSEWIRKKKAKRKSNQSSSTEDVDFRLDARVDHLLLDEFQDTSPVQWDIVRPFAEAITRERMRRDRSFFCVGDGKQAIYGWRGGVAEILHSVVGTLKTQEDSLTQSYRSSPDVIEFVNEVFQNLSKHPNYGDGQPIVTHWQTQFPPHDTAKAKLPGYVQYWNGESSSRNRSDANSEEEESLDNSLLTRAAADIAELASQAPHVSIGVLVRRNEDVAGMIHRLRQLRVDASQEGGNPLTDSAPVDLLLRLLHLADHPADRIAAFQVGTSPMASLLEPNPLDHPHQLAESIRLDIANSGYGPTIARYADKIAPVCNERDQQRLEQLIQMAYRYDVRPAKRIRDFVLFVEQERVALPTPSQVRVMTIHMSKGLEFDAVFLPALSQSLAGLNPTFVTRAPDALSPPDGVLRHVSKDLRGFLPTSWQQAFDTYSQSILAEALCVFYVALTRARQALYLYGQTTKNPSARWDSVLQSILCLSQELKQKTNQIIFQAGQQDWYRRQTNADVPRHPDAKTTAESLTSAEAQTADESDNKSASDAAVKLTIQLHRPTPAHSIRLRPALRPSSAHVSRTVSLASALEASGSTGAIIGTLVHRWFEEVLWLDDFIWDREAMRKLAVAAITPEEMAQIDLDAELLSMEKRIALPSVQQSLSRARYQSWLREGVEQLEVSNERRLLEIFEGSILRGTIDRLVLGWRKERVARAEVLDFKTDRRHPDQSAAEWREERAGHHRPQLELYRRVLCKQFGLEPPDVQLTLILLSDDHCLSLDAVPVPRAKHPGKGKSPHRTPDLFTPSLFPEDE